MPRLLIVGVLITLGFSASALRAQQDSPPLQRVINFSFDMRLPLTFCDVPAAVAGLAKKLEFVAGIEYLAGDCQEAWRNEKRSNDAEPLAGLTVEAALNKLVELDPRYRWVESEGVIVVRPLAAWGDPKNWLNQSIGPFVVDDQDLVGALSEVACHIPDRPFPERPCHRSDNEIRIRTELGARRFSVNLAAASIIGALNAIVSTHGAMWWEARDRAGVTRPEDQRMLWVFTPDGSGLGRSTKRYPTK
jgi:hypothetical protein